MKILVVDDELFLANALCDYLVQDGHTCAARGSGREALQYASEKRPEVVITDFNMPEMNGIELLRELHTRHPEIRGIILTAFADVENAIEAVNAGVTAYYRKPLDLQALRDGLARVAEEIARGERNRLRQESLKQECARLRASLSTLEHMLNQVRQQRPTEN